MVWLIGAVLFAASPSAHAELITPISQQRSVYAGVEWGEPWSCDCAGFSAGDDEDSSQAPNFGSYVDDVDAFDEIVGQSSVGSSQNSNILTSSISASAKVHAVAKNIWGACYEVCGEEQWCECVYESFADAQGESLTQVTFQLNANTTFALSGEHGGGWNGPGLVTVNLKLVGPSGTVFDLEPQWYEEEWGEHWGQNPINLSGALPAGQYTLTASIVADISGLDWGPSASGHYSFLLAFGPPPVVGDIDCNGDVDGADLGLLLGAWGSGAGPADLDGNGIVDGADLGILLSAWTG